MATFDGTSELAVRLARDLEVLHSFPENLWDIWPAPTDIPTLYALAPEADDARALINKAIASVQERPADLRTRTGDPGKLRRGLQALVGLGSQPTTTAVERRHEAAGFLNYKRESLRTSPEIRERHFVYLASRMLSVAGSPSSELPPPEAGPPHSAESPEQHRDRLPDRVIAPVAEGVKEQLTRPQPVDDSSDEPTIGHDAEALDGHAFSEPASLPSIAEPPPSAQVRSEMWAVPVLASGPFRPGATILEVVLDGRVMTLDNQPGPALPPNFAPSRAHPQESVRYIERTAKLRNHQPRSAGASAPRSRPRGEATSVPDILAERLVLAAWTIGEGHAGRRPRTRPYVQLEVNISPASRPPALEVTAFTALSDDQSTAEEGKAWSQSLKVAPGAVVTWRVEAINRSDQTLRNPQIKMFAPRYAEPLLGRTTAVQHSPDSPRPRTFVTAGQRLRRGEQTEMPPTLPPGHRIEINQTARVGNPAERRKMVCLFALAVADGEPAVGTHADLVIVTER